MAYHLFQFTHPVWGATNWLLNHAGATTFQFTHPVWGATLLLSYFALQVGVSIHAPRVGCDPELRYFSVGLLAFQFTHPVWGATAMPKGTHK